MATKQHTVLYIEETSPDAIWFIIQEEMKIRKLGTVEVHVPMTANLSEIAYPGRYGYAAGSFSASPDFGYGKFFVSKIPEGMLS